MSSSPLCPQPFLHRAYLPPARARRAQRRSAMKTPRRRTRRRVSTTQRWTGGSSCVTPGTWSPPSGQGSWSSCNSWGLFLMSSHLLSSFDPPFSHPLSVSHPPLCPTSLSFPPLLYSIHLLILNYCCMCTCCACVFFSFHPSFLLSTSFSFPFAPSTL